MAMVSEPAEHTKYSKTNFNNVQASKRSSKSKQTISCEFLTWKLQTLAIDRIFVAHEIEFGSEGSMAPVRPCQSVIDCQNVAVDGGGGWVSVAAIIRANPLDHQAELMVAGRENTAVHDLTSLECALVPVQRDQTQPITVRRYHDGRQLDWHRLQRVQLYYARNGGLVDWTNDLVACSGPGEHYATHYGLAMTARFRHWRGNVLRMANKIIN